MKAAPEVLYTDDNSLLLIMLMPGSDYSVVLQEYHLFDPARMIGSSLGNYDIQALLGTGGMASVYRGLDRHLQRQVAIKVIAPALAADPDFALRFRKEAQLIANLRHPNVVQIYSFGEQNDLLYMVQELLPGPTLDLQLANAITQGANLERHVILSVVRDLAGALDAAHAVGVIHRDVKPSNAIYNVQQQIVLTDFGIARTTTDPTRTAAGILMGTPGYVAPEQAVSSTALTPACDIYALGVVTFELLTGRRPFEADTPAAVIIKHLYETPVAASSLRPALPPAVDATLLRALAKEPGARFASAGAFAHALAQAWPDVALQQPAITPILHNQPTQVWAGRPALSATTATRSVGLPASAELAPANPAAPLSVGQPGTATPQPRLLLSVLGALLLLLLVAGGLLATIGNRTAASEAPTQPAAPTQSAAVVPTAGATATEAQAATQEPTLTLVPATAEPPTVVPPTEVIVIDPLEQLGTVISNGLNDGSAGDDAPEYWQRYGYLAEAISNGDDKEAETQLRELARKIAERAREGKLDASFNEQVQALLLNVADQYGLKRPNQKGNDD